MAWPLTKQDGLQGYVPLSRQSADCLYLYVNVSSKSTRTLEKDIGNRRGLTVQTSSTLKRGLEWVMLESKGKKHLGKVSIVFLEILPCCNLL